jgi:signal transduction histidine kinase
MKALRLFQSLRFRIMAAVVACAVVPLAAVGLWLTSGAARSGEMLLRSQLDSAVERASTGAEERWRHRRSDVLLLASNEPIRAALRTPNSAAGPPRFVQRAFETMPNVAAVVVRDARDSVRWTLGELPAGIRQSGATTPGASTSAPTLEIREPVRDTTGATIGDVLAYVRVDGLVPGLASSSSVGGQFIAVYDRVRDAWLRPGTVLPSALRSDTFTFESQRWLTARRRLTAPALDIVAAGALDPFVRPFGRTAAIGTLALFLVAAAVMTLTMFVTMRLTGSLTELAIAADAVAAGDLEPRLDQRSNDEVGRVARAFKEMTETLRRTLHALAQREAVAAMGEMAGALAHQVRSPLTALRLDVERAHGKLAADSPESALLARALDQLGRLERAVEGSLKVARGSGAGTFRDLDLREPLQRAIAGASLGDGEPQRVVTIDVSNVSRSPLPVRGDPASLEQLFANILANGVEAAGPAGLVAVSAESGEQRVRVTIRDDGPGMSPDVLARAGEPLFSTKPAGTGLGLAISKRIAVSHRGAISLESEAGAGTTVSIELPAKK